MKKSHIITYITALLLMLGSYLFYVTSFKTGELTLYEHSFHLFGIVLVFVPFLFEIRTIFKCMAKFKQFYFCGKKIFERKVKDI